MGSFQHSKWSDNKRCTVEVKWGIFIENWLYFFIHKSVRKNSHTNSYNFAMTLISQDDHLTAGTWVACGMRDLANASLWSRKWWSKLKTTFLFLSVYSNWTRDASLHPYCSPNIWHPTRGTDGCTFYFSPIFKLFREIFYETTTQLSNVEHGLENQSWPASPISRAKFSKESLRNTTCTVAQNMRKKIKTILEIWAEVWPLCSNQRPKPKQMPCLPSLTEFQWYQ